MPKWQVKRKIIGLIANLVKSETLEVIMNTSKASRALTWQRTAENQSNEGDIVVDHKESWVWSLIIQCRSKGNISGGARELRRRKPLGGSGGMLPQKILKSRGLEMLFQALSKRYLWFTHVANYLLRTLSRQTNAHWEYNTCNVNYKIENRLSLYLETSKCFTFQSHHSKFVVIKPSELP